jgi:L-ascorbate metabolism protein UlaG (beta-lactamase superfamily)
MPRSSDPIRDYPESPQWTNGRFRNLTPRPPSSPRPGRKVLWDFLFNKPRNTVPAAPVPVRRLTRAALDAAADRSLYRLGHSTLLMKLRGGWWLTDPVFSKRASPFGFFGPKRFHAPPISLDELPPIRGVILSHDHYDHLDKAAVRALARKAQLFISPLGVGDRLIDWGVDAGKVRQFDWWQSIGVDRMRFTCAPAQHFSGRALHDGNRTLWCSWAIEDEALRVYFSGDGGYSSHFAEVGRRLGPFDLTLMETGAYNAHWPYVHMQPDETVQAHLDLRGGWLLPIHNGTFDLAMHAWQEPFERVVQIAHARNVLVTTPMMGEHVDMSAPHPGERWWQQVVAAEQAVHVAAGQRVRRLCARS